MVSGVSSMSSMVIRPGPPWWCACVPGSCVWRYRRRSGNRPARCRSSVDLPAPFGPSSATRSPASIVQRDVVQGRRPVRIVVTQSLDADTGGAGRAVRSCPASARAPACSTASARSSERSSSAATSRPNPRTRVDRRERRTALQAPKPGRRASRARSIACDLAQHDGEAGQHGLEDVRQPVGKRRAGGRRGPGRSARGTSPGRPRATPRSRPGPAARPRRAACEPGRCQPGRRPDEDGHERQRATPAPAACRPRRSRRA